jgi:hypothetical protein
MSRFGGPFDRTAGRGGTVQANVGRAKSDKTMIAAAVAVASPRMLLLVVQYKGYTEKSLAECVCAREKGCKWNDTGGDR